MSKQGYFITGTDTGVGKTVVSTILAVGMRASYWKPLQTGSREGTDSDFVRKWLGSKSVSLESYIFPEPLSPHVAAEIQKTEITLQKCLEDSTGLSPRTIIEGAGGVLVPINSSCLMIDLIQELNRPTVVVTSTKLGTINHSLLTLEALKHRGISIAGVITVGDENQNVQRSIQQYGEVPLIGHIPHCSSFSLRWFEDTYQQLAIAKIE